MRNAVFVVENAGWHFSSVGGIQANIIKLASNVHGAEYPNITEKILETWMEITPCIPIDSLFPQCIIDNLETYIQNELVKED